MKRFFFVATVLFCCVLMAVPSAMAAKAKKIRFSHVVSENTPKGWAANEFAMRVNKALEGRYKVVVFPMHSFTATTRPSRPFPPGLLRWRPLHRQNLSGLSRRCSFLTCRFSFRASKPSTRSLMERSAMRFERCSWNGLWALS